MPELTYDPTPADQPEFNQSEQEALARGEQMEAEESNMLAGKFRSTEDLEQAYIELQKKLGNQDGEEESSEPSEEAPEEELTEIDTFIASASEEYYSNDGELSQETFDKLSEMDSSDLVNAYLKSQANQPQAEAAPGAELSESDASSIRGVAGGDEQYGNLLQWAGDNLPDPMIESFDALVESGDTGAIKLAVRGLMAEYESQNGNEGQLLTGRGASDVKDVFRSQQEVVAAMSDPRYDRDPAYRNDVFEKLSRSDVAY
jgi:hypothetical protein